MSITTKPTVVLVPGAWNVPQHYTVIRDMLHDEGFDVHIPRLLTAGELCTRYDLSDDVQVVQKVLSRLADEGKKVIVIAHSYGGIVATEALRDFSYQDRKKNGLPGGVLHIVYMCAYMLRPGESILSATHPAQDPDPVSRFEDGFSIITDPKQTFYGDVDDESARGYAALLVPQALKAFIRPTSYPAWRYIPTTYLKCTEDQALLPQAQENFITAAQEIIEVEVHTFKASHSPFISMPVNIVGVIRATAAKYQ